jgi:hypothetical protein
MQLSLWCESRRRRMLSPWRASIAEGPDFMLQSVHRSLGSAPDAGLIDVRGVPSGTEIQDQYSGQTIRVP